MQLNLVGVTVFTEIIPQMVANVEGLFYPHQ